MQEISIYAVPAITETHNQVKLASLDSYPSLDRILEACIHIDEITFAKMISRDRHRRIVDAKRHFILLASMHPYSYQQIGNYVNLHHSTAIFHMKRGMELMQNPSERDFVDKLMRISRIVYGTVKLPTIADYQEVNHYRK